MRNYVVSIIFFIIIVFPLTNMIILKIPDLPQPDFRTVAEYPGPATKIVDFPKGFESYFNDNFSFRNTLIWLSGTLHHQIFNVSISDSVLPGKDGWLFLDSIGLMDDYHGKIKMSENELFSLREFLLELQEYLNDRDVIFVIAIPPNSHTINGEEFLPDYLNYSFGNESRLDQMLSYMEAHGGPTIVDMRAELIAARETSKLYFTTDSHWNAIGAEIGYRKMIDQVNDAAEQAGTGKTVVYPTYEMKKTITYFCDLARMVADWRIAPEDIYVPVFVPPLQYEYTEDSADGMSVSTNGMNSLSIALFGDSYGMPWYELLYGTFEDVRIDRRFVTAGIDAVINEESPDIVVFERIEYGVRDWLTAENPANISAVRRERIFESGYEGGTFDLLVEQVIQLPASDQKERFDESYMIRLRTKSETACSLSVYAGDALYEEVSIGEGESFAYIPLHGVDSESITCILNGTSVTVAEGEIRFVDYDG
jgi:hypothetical protein